MAPVDETRRRILLVEDHEHSAKAIARLLGRAGYEVRVVGSVKSALAAAEAAPFDLLVSDLGLPDGSGNDLMRQLRARHNLRGIALSGFGMEEDIARSREAGFEAHLVKPVRVQQLLAIIRDLPARAS
jgi:DNA-binding response OmpR family regulator